MSNLPSLLALKPLLEDGSRALQKIADAEALERQCQRARDSEGMYKAAETKVLEQAKYVCLRDAAVAIARTTNPGPGRGHKNQVAKNQLGFPAGDPGKHTVHKWRKAFCRKNAEGRTEIDVEKMRLALEDAARRCVRVCEQEKISIIPGTEGTGEFLRYTPRDQVAAVRAALGEIDLDPASDALGQKTVGAIDYFAVEDNSLEREWPGRVFLNPPYNRNLAPAFISKLLQELEAGRTTAAILLTNNCTDTDWFDVALRRCAGVCFTHSRIRFTKPDGSKAVPNLGQAFFYFGRDVQRFEDVFCSIGNCFPPPRRAYQPRT